MPWPTTSRQSRGYGRKWELLRAFVLERDGRLCQCSHCKAEERTRIATEVDHVVSKAKAASQGWTQQQIDDPANLQAINSDCHKRKGIEDQGGTPRERVRIGADGWPIT